MTIRIDVIPILSWTVVTVSSPQCWHFSPAGFRPRSFLNGILFLFLLLFRRLETLLLLVLVALLVLASVLLWLPFIIVEFVVVLLLFLPGACITAGSESLVL